MRKDNSKQSITNNANNNSNKMKVSNNAKSTNNNTNNIRNNNTNNVRNNKVGFKVSNSDDTGTETNVPTPEQENPETESTTVNDCR